MEFHIKFAQGRLFILETVILARPLFQILHYDRRTLGWKVQSGEYQVKIGEKFLKYVIKSAKPFI